MPATTTARTNSRTPDARAAFCSEIAKVGVNCKSTTVADSNSTKLSEPNERIAGLCAVHAANADTPHSISIHAMVMLCSHKTDGEGRGLWGDAPPVKGWEPIWRSSDTVYPNHSPTAQRFWCGYSSTRTPP